MSREFSTSDRSFRSVVLCCHQPSSSVVPSALVVSNPVLCAHRPQHDALGKHLLSFAWRTRGNCKRQIDLTGGGESET